MKKLFFHGLSAVALCAAPPAMAGAASPFACRLLEASAPLPELSTYSGYRWIECRVLGLEAADIESVSVNNGKCATFDYWYARRVFAKGEAVNIPYACMSPVTLAIAANGLIFKMRLRQPEGGRRKTCAICS